MTGKQAAPIASRMQRVVRKAEAEARTETGQDTGTGQTIIKLTRHQPPLRSLVESGKIGSVELQAAEEISLAVSAISSRNILSAAILASCTGRHGASQCS